MRKSTALWLLLAFVCGVLLFQTSQQVTDGRQTLAALQKDIRREEESLRVLQAEWSYLNQPDRLERLNKQYLSLVPMKGSQFATLDVLKVLPAEETAPETPPPAVAAAPAPAASAPPVKPAAPVAQKMLAPPAVPALAPQKAAQQIARGFGDVLKSLDTEAP